MMDSAGKEIKVYDPIAEIPKRIENAEEVYGGLVVELKLPWDFPQKLDDEEFSQETRLLERCLKMVHTCEVFSEIGDRRRHGTLIERGSIVYFPEPTERLKLPSKLGTHLWQVFNKNLKPDKNFIKYLEDVRLIY